MLTMVVVVAAATADQSRRYTDPDLSEVTTRHQDVPHLVFAADRAIRKELQNGVPLHAMTAEWVAAVVMESSAKEDVRVCASVITAWQDANRHSFKCRLPVSQIKSVKPGRPQRDIDVCAFGPVTVVDFSATMHSKTSKVNVSFALHRTRPSADLYFKLSLAPAPGRHGATVAYEGRTSGPVPEAEGADPRQVLAARRVATIGYSLCCEAELPAVVASPVPNACTADCPLSHPVGDAAEAPQVLFGSVEKSLPIDLTPQAAAEGGEPAGVGYVTKFTLIDSWGADLGMVTAPIRLVLHASGGARSLDEADAEEEDDKMLDAAIRKLVLRNDAASEADKTGEDAAK